MLCPSLFHPQTSNHSFQETPLELAVSVPFVFFFSFWTVDSSNEDKQISIAVLSIFVLIFALFWFRRSGEPKLRLPPSPPAPVACRCSDTFHFYPSISTVPSPIWLESTAQFSSSASEPSSASSSPPLPPSMRPSTGKIPYSPTEIPTFALFSLPTAAPTAPIGRS